MGRPRKTLTTDQIEQVGKLAALLTLDQIADFLGVSTRTVRRRMKEDSRVLSAYQKGKSGALASVASNLIKQATEGNVVAAIFYLKTQGGWKEAKDADTSFVYEPDRFTMEGNRRVADGESPHIVAASGGLRET